MFYDKACYAALSGWTREELRDRIIGEAFRRGLLLSPCGSSGIWFAPPLCINQVQIEVGLEVLEEAIATVNC